VEEKGAKKILFPAAALAAHASVLLAKKPSSGSNQQSSASGEEIRSASPTVTAGHLRCSAVPEKTTVVYPTPLVSPSLQIDLEYRSSTSSPLIGLGIRETRQLTKMMVCAQGVCPLLPRPSTTPTAAENRTPPRRRVKFAPADGLSPCRSLEGVVVEQHPPRDQNNDQKNSPRLLRLLTATRRHNSQGTSPSRAARLSGSCERAGGRDQQDVIRRDRSAVPAPAPSEEAAAAAALLAHSSRPTRPRTKRSRSGVTGRDPQPVGGSNGAVWGRAAAPDLPCGPTVILA
jgi:hypothetical protein